MAQLGQAELLHAGKGGGGGGGGGRRGGAKQFIVHSRTENKHKDLSRMKGCLVQRCFFFFLHRSNCRQSNISILSAYAYCVSTVCLYMLFCGPSSNSGDYNLQQRANYVLFILTLPPACSSNWLFSEHMTRAAPLPLCLSDIKPAFAV